MLSVLEIKSIGILGGTFDPIHIGHVAICRIVREKFSLDRVEIVPAFRNPTRVQAGVSASTTDRLIMAHLACLEIPWIYVNSVEIERGRRTPGPSFTIDTLRHYIQRYPETELTLIVGADNCAFHLWHDIGLFPELLRRIVVVSRPGFEEDMDKYMETTERQFPGVFSIIETIADVRIPKSATDVRINTHNGAIPVDHLHESVEKYIRKYRLYGWRGES